MTKPESSLAPYKDLTVGNLLTQLSHNYLTMKHWSIRIENLRLTFSQLERRARIIAKGLIKLGVEKGDRVALWGDKTCPSG